MGPQKLFCPRCNSLLVTRAESTDPLDRQLATSAIYAFECRSCGHRFRASQQDVPPPAEPQDRRKTPRTPIRMPVDFEWGEHAGDGTVTDISKGGCAVESQRRLNAGLLLLLKFPPSVRSTERDTPQQIASVQNVRGERAGMKFLAFTQAEQLALAQTVAQSIQLFASQPG